MPRQITQAHRAFNPDAPRRRFAVLLATLLLASADVALAQATAQPVAPQGAGASQSEVAPATAEQSVGLAADLVTYDNEADVITASGSVELEREGWRLRADQVGWNRKTSAVVASGNVALTSPQGDIAYGDRIELTDTLRDGVVENLLVVLESGARLAANRGTRLNNGDMQLERAAYSPCAVTNPDGCPRDPTWQLRAVRVYYDRAANRIRYYGARVELFGLPLIPLPGLSHPGQRVAGSGFLVPDVRIDRINGLEFALPYYLRLGTSQDLTVTPHVYTNAAPMLETEFRTLTDRGAISLKGYGTYSRRVGISGIVTDGESRFRGALEGHAGFQFGSRWSLSASSRVVTDRTFLRRYDITRDDRLRSTFSLERNGGSSYLQIAGWAVQTLRVNDIQKQQPVALPVIDFRQRIDDPVLGGTAQVQINTLALTRLGGQDTQRLFASADWKVRRLLPTGQVFQLSTLVRGDIYHTQSIGATPVPSYRGQAGWQGRAIAASAVDLTWPFVGPLSGGRQLLTPHVQIVATSPVRNVDIPNEDSRAFELDDSNIFSINRFPGYDRFEDGARITYGAEWAFNRPGLAITSEIAQSYRLSDRSSLFADGTGLAARASDIVGRSTIAYRSFIRLTHRFRLDKDSLAIRRNEVDATIGSRRTYAVIGYSRLNRNIAALGEDLRDQEEARVGGRIQLARYWSIFGSAIVDLTGPRDDAQVTTDGFTPVRHRVGVAYDDDCLTIALTWRRDYLDRGDARAGNSYLLRLEFRNLGV